MQETGLGTLTTIVTALVSLIVALVLRYIKQLKDDNRLHFVERKKVSDRLLIVETRMSNGIVEDLRELRKEVKELTRKLDSLVAAWKARNA